MSLILDALRRADSERERGAVPGLHAQPIPLAAREANAAERRQRWIWIIAAVGVVVGLAWIAVGRVTPWPAAPPIIANPPATAIGAAPAASASPSASDSRGAAAGTAAHAPALQQTPMAAPAPAADSAPPVREPRPVAEPAPWTTSDAARKSPAAQIVVAPAGNAGSGPSQQPVANAPAGDPILTREQLPENIRAQLPPLAVGGSIYSLSAPDRSVIIDGRLLREKDHLGADLALEQIRPKSVVLRFRNYRFEIGL
jgi:general secretion pathway protein B